MRTASPARGAAPRLEPPGMRAGVVFGALILLFAGLGGRALYLQWIDNEFLQGQGQARHTRDIEMPAHRGRILDRHGEALAISTPVKSLWAFPDRLEMSPGQLTELARVLETGRGALERRIAAAEDFVYVAKQVPPEVAERALALRIKGLHDETTYGRYYPAGEIAAHVVGFTGTKDAGQEGIELAQQAWLGGHVGSRRVIINRRGDVVEDVDDIPIRPLKRERARAQNRGTPLRCCK